jgi:cell division septal protein FtsQ
VNRHTLPPRTRRRSLSGLPVEGAIPPRGPRVIRRRHTGAWLALTFTLLAVVSLTVALRLQHTGYFKITKVQISGTQALDPALVANTSGVLGKQAYDLDSATASAAIQRLPLVQSAHVARAWPDTAIITVQERKPWGTWQIGGVNYLIDENGIVLDIVGTPWPTTVYELDAAPGLRPGDHVDGDAVRVARLLLNELPHTMFQQVARLEYSTEGGLDLLTGQSVRVRIGDSQALGYKLAVWQAVSAKAGANQIHLIDLRSVDRPYYR